MTFLGLDAEQWWQVGPTVALVLVTMAYVYITGSMAGHAKSSADSAATSARAAQRALQLSAMPIFYGRAALKFTDKMIRVWVDALTDAPAFRLQAKVRQGDQEWASTLHTYMQAGDEQLAVDIDVETLPNFDQPYNVEMTYSDALGTYYKTERVGYIIGSDFKLEEWSETDQEWMTLV